MDDLDALADFAAREGLWLHADAAYGGFFALTERGRATLAGLSRADSIVLDPHKGLFMPYGSGCLLVKDPGALRRSHSVQAHYMPGMQDDPDSVDFCEISPELSRNFRGLSVWLAVKLCGLAAFRASLDEKLDLAREAADAVRAIPGVDDRRRATALALRVPARAGGGVARGGEPPEPRAHGARERAPARAPDRHAPRGRVRDPDVHPAASGRTRTASAWPWTTSGRPPRRSRRE